MSTLGVIASPVAGKDVRRLVANAGSVGDTDKIAAIRRAVFGAVEAGVERVLVLDDTRHLVLRACEGVAATVELLPVEPLGAGADSRRAAAALAQAAAGAVLVFGGDGTNRDVARGWPDAPVVPLAVGTNNVFPFAIEATLGGVAAGLVATGQLDLTDVARRAKVIHVHLEDGAEDLALVDVVLVAGGFIGSRAVWHVEDLHAAVFAIAEPATVGLSSIGATVAPVARHDDLGVALRIAPGAATQVRAPIAPGTYATVGIDSWQVLELAQPVTLHGPGVLAFDGERDHVLHGADAANAVLRRDGPWVIDPVGAMELAAAKRLFTVDQHGPGPYAN